jgi:hypothetical protein
MSYILQRDHWWDIIFLNIYAPTEDKIDYLKERFYEELEHMFEKLHKYRINILLGYFNAKINIFNQTIGNESLHEISNANRATVVKYATSKNCIVKSTKFPHPKMYKFTRKSPD